MSRKVIYLVSLLISFLNFSALAETIKVCKDCEISSIQVAVKKMNEGDSIIIHAGTYNEGNIVIEKSGTILGVNYPVLEGGSKVEILTVKANNVTVKGISFKHSGRSSLYDLAAIKLFKVKNVKVTENQLEDNYFGIYLLNCSDCVVSGNKIKGAGLSQQGSGNGIHLWRCTNIKIENNEARGHRDGIYFEFVTASTIVNNVSEKNLRYGLHFMFSDNDSYQNNVFRENGAGVAVMYSKNVKMKGNHFQLNWGSGAFGILLKEISDSEITSNKFEGNTTGIYAESASRISVTKNVFSKNGWALRITSSCDELNVKENNFISNTFDMASMTANTITHNSYDGNYWDKYDGYDLNKDKNGDIPYYPVSLSTMLVEKIPTSAYFLHSFVLNLINQTEKMLPNLIPEGIKDNSPSMKKLVL